MNKRNQKVKVSLSEEEKKKLEHDSALCGLSQNEFLRRICLDKIPPAKAPAEFWDLMEAIYDLHKAWKKLIVYCPEATGECRRLETLVLFLQKEVA